MSKTRLPELSLAVQYACHSPHLPTRAQFRRWFRKAMGSDANITVRIVDAAEGRQLNKQYRNKDYATNVLTFVYDEESGSHEIDCAASAINGNRNRKRKPTLHGDVVICAPVVEQEAAQQHKAALAHYAHLSVHAALHLQGYQHEEESDAVEMESLESALMLKLRFPDPYEAEQH